MRKKETPRQRVIKRLRQIANEEGITYTEVHNAFNSQFKFTKEKIEELEEEHIANASKEELEEYVFNFIYLGKVHTNQRLQALTNKRKEKQKSRKKNGRDESNTN